MSRRRYSVRAQCAKDGCKEHTFYEAHTRAEERELRRGTATRWRCWRHLDNDGMLTPDNPRFETIIEARRSDTYPNLTGLFWHGRCLTSGKTHGLGWRAAADMFPPGTRIRIVAEVIPPDPK